MQTKIYSKEVAHLAKFSRGLTLIELMVTVAVIGVILVFATPNFSDFIAKRRVNSTVNQFAASMRVAKSEAQTVGRNVALCAVDASGTACKGGADWSSGWMVYVQGNTTTTVQKVIQVYQADSENISIGLSEATDGVITLTPSGISTSKAVIKVKPKNLSPNLGKTMTYEDVTLKLDITDGAV